MGVCIKGFNIKLTSGTDEAYGDTYEKLEILIENKVQIYRRLIGTVNLLLIYAPD